MVFVRKIKKGDKFYEYFYKSERINGKVKSIYMGKKDISEKKAINFKDDFEAILIKINKAINDNEINNANEIYNKLLNEYDKISNKVEDKEKIELFNKTKEIYDKLKELNEIS